jgi:hypothetical protein
MGFTMQGWHTTFLGMRELPRDISDFETKAFFTFDGAEREAIDARRGDAHKLGLALHIGLLWHHKAHHTALLASCFRHTFAGVRHRCAPHSTAHGIPQSGHYLALSQDRHRLAFCAHLL